jgi:hypothetical protein
MDFLRLRWGGFFSPPQSGTNKGGNMDGKPIYQSKTLIFNVLAVAVMVANQFGFSEFELEPEIAAMVVAVINFVLRFVTKKPLLLP